MKNIWIITLFPSFFDVLFKTGVVGSALRGERGMLPKLHFLNPTDFCEKGFKGVDSAPYGGGAGQILRGDVLEKTLVEGIKNSYPNSVKNIKEILKVIYLGPRGKKFDQNLAWTMVNNFKSSEERDIAFICGRYEGIDERFIEKYVEEHLSLGDFVLSGGEVALIPILDSIFRLMPGVLRNEESSIVESFNGDGLEFPQYTRPRFSCDKEVPDILLKGNHEKIRQWRNVERIRMTKEFRPDLLKENEK